MTSRNTLLRNLLLFIAACGPGAFAGNAYELAVRDIEGNETRFNVADGLAMSVNEDALIIHSTDALVECELQSLYGFRYVKKQNVPSSVEAAGNDCQLEITREGITINSGNRDSRCEIFDMAGLKVFERQFSGQESISFRQFRQGVYAIRIDGVTKMKFAVK